MCAAFETRVRHQSIDAGREFFAPFHDAPDPDRGNPALGRAAAESDLVADLKRALGPTRARQAVRAGELSLPLFHLSSGWVLGLHGNEHVRIHELKIGDGTGNSDSFRCVVGGRPMMRKGRERKHQQSREASQRRTF